MPEIGQTVSHYRIVEKRGGGMGVVYKAEDTKLSWCCDRLAVVVIRGEPTYHINSVAGRDPDGPSSKDVEAKTVLLFLIEREVIIWPVARNPEIAILPGGPL